MAKKKRSSKKKGRRRVGAIGKQGITQAAMGILGVTLGFVGARLANSLIAPTTATTSSTMTMGIAGAEIVAGGAITIKAKSLLVKGLGLGLAGGGGVTLLGQSGLKVLPASMGYGPGLQQQYRVNGFRDVPAIGFPKPGNIGRPRGSNMEMARQARMYAGIYN